MRGELARPRLVAHRVDPARRRPDEAHARVDHALRECRVLRQEAVARMQRHRRRDCLQHVEQRILVEIALARGRGADGVGLARQREIRRAGVGFGIHRDRANAHLVQRAQHARRDGAAVGYHDFVEHV